MGVIPPELARFLFHYEKDFDSFVLEYMISAKPVYNPQSGSKAQDKPDSVDPTAHTSFNWMGCSPSWLGLLMNWTFSNYRLWIDEVKQ